MSAFGKLKIYSYRAALVLSCELLRDTVASVGFTYKELPFVNTNTAFRVFRHALSLDERRAKFKPNFYHVVSPFDTTGKTYPIPEIRTPTSDPSMADIDMETANTDVLSEPERTIYPKADLNTTTDACEVWFAGCHCGALHHIVKSI